MFCSFIPRQTNKSSLIKPALPKILIRELAAGGVRGIFLRCNSSNTFRAEVVVVVVGEIKRRLISET
jgi:hypothetical protein